MTLLEPDRTEQISRRRFLARAGTTGLGAGLALAGGGLLAARPARAAADDPGLDAKIITAAVTAEALATTMYYHIISSSLYRSGLAGNVNDQAYLMAGFEQEYLHYALLLGAGGTPLAKKFYFPVGMFGGPDTYATTVNTLITLEDAFIAAYLIGIRDLSSPGLKVLAGQILGVECEHRALGRVVAADLGLPGTTGLSGQEELVNGPSDTSNNLAYERTFSTLFQSIDDVVGALLPFVQPGTPGFGKKAYPFTPHAPANIAPVNLATTAP